MTVSPPRAILWSVMPNPLAIGVTIGGLLLDIVVPRPKPRYGAAGECTPRARYAGSRTARPELESHEGQPVAGGPFS